MSTTSAPTTAAAPATVDGRQLKAPTGAQVLLLTPFDEEGRIDERSLAALIEYVLGGGVDGIVGCGTTGEFFTLSLEEQQQLMRLIAEQVRGRVPLTFGIGSTSTSVSIALARLAQELGADCAMLQPPYYFAHASDAIDAHVLAVAHAVEIPVMVYDGAAGIELSVERVHSLHQRAANVRYVKMSVPDPAKVGAMRAGAPYVEPLAGDENMLLMGLRHGAIGSTVGWSNVDPEAISGIHRRFEAGDLDSARALLLHRVVPAVAVCITAKNAYIRCYKEILAAKGVIASPTTRLPLTPLDPIRKDEVLAAMRELSVL
jgi:4-hydroxy-tetrahydrodipicolinate synthase